MNATAGITLFVSVPAQPAPTFDGDASPIGFGDGALIFFVSIPANTVADF